MVQVQGLELEDHLVRGRGGGRNGSEKEPAEPPLHQPDHPSLWTPAEAPVRGRQAAPGKKRAHRQRVHVEDEEVEGHGEADGTHQPDVHPGRHPHKGLILRQAARGRRVEPGWGAHRGEK